MHNQSFSITEIYRFVFQTIFKHFWFLFKIIFLMFILLALVIEIFDQKALLSRGDLKPFFFLLSLFILWFGSFIKLGYIKVLLELYDKGFSSMGTLFSCAPLAFRNILAGMLYGLLCSLGFILIFPGIYFSIKYGFFSQFIVDKNVGVVETFRKSAEITRDVKWKLFGIDALFFLIYLLLSVLKDFFVAMFVKFGLLSDMFLFVNNILSAGIFILYVTIPGIAYAFIYRRLLSTSHV